MKIKKRHIIGGIAAVGLIGGLYLNSSTPPVKRIGPAYLYPDGKETPCAIATSDFKELTANYNGQTYSKAHRNTSQELKKRVCEIYSNNCDVPKEIDHCIPLALGGQDSLLNLWAEPETQMWNGENWGFHRKDALENYLVLQMKAAFISPQDAQDCIKSDWVACYKRFIKSASLGIGKEENEDLIDAGGK